MEVQSKNKNERPVKLQLHVYYTNQAVMVQGHRKVSAVKGYKLFVEDFFQPYVEMVANTNKNQIEQTKVMLDKHGESEKSEEVEERKNVDENTKIKELAEEIVHDMVKKASSDDAAKEKRLNFTKCAGIFFLENKLEEHMNRVHTEVKLDCELGKLKFQSKDGIHDYTNQNHSEDKTYLQD